MTTEEDGNSLDGTPPETFTPELERAGADVIGVNCSVGPAAMLETVETMARLTRARLAAQPNAGRPRDVDGRNLYLCSPEYMATYARRFISAGARLVGGCCGTTPEHIRQIAAAVRTTAPRAVRPKPELTPDDEAAPVSAVARRDKSALGRALDERRFVIVAEVSAPRGLDLGRRGGPGKALPRSRRHCDQRARLPEIGGPRDRARARRAAATEPRSRRCCTTPAATGI